MWTPQLSNPLYIARIRQLRSLEMSLRGTVDPLDVRLGEEACAWGRCRIAPVSSYVDYDLEGMNLVPCILGPIGRKILPRVSTQSIAQEVPMTFHVSSCCCCLTHFWQLEFFWSASCYKDFSTFNYLASSLCLLSSIYTSVVNVLIESNIFGCSEWKYLFYFSNHVGQVWWFIL
jgi:hypothetical protein